MLIRDVLGCLDIKNQEKVGLIFFEEKRSRQYFLCYFFIQILFKWIYHFLIFICFLIFFHNFISHDFRKFFMRSPSFHFYHRSYFHLINSFLNYCCLGYSKVWLCIFMRSLFLNPMI